MTDARDQLIEELRTIIAQQQKIIAAQQQLIVELQAKLEVQERTHTERAAALEREVKRLERELFGSKTERDKPDEGSTPVPPVDRDMDLDDEERARMREKAAEKRRERALAKAAAMVCEEEEIPVPDAQKQCPKCNGTKFGNLKPEPSTTFEYVPGHFVRRLHKRQKLACSCGQYIVVAPPVAKLIPGGRYGYGFAAFLVVEKCGDSIPIYRIEKRFERLGIPMSRATMNDVLHAAAELASPLIARMQQRVSELEIVLADETSMRLQDRKKRGFFWVFQGRDERTQGELVLYVFAADRSGQTPVRVLGGTTGTLLVDGYTGYNVVTDPDGRSRAGCWCHLRRKFFEARNAPDDDADVAIKKIRGIFRVEHDATELAIVGTAQHLALRQERTKPIVEDFYAWAKAKRGSSLPKGPLGEALGYALNQQSRMELFLTDARIPAHNNASERRLRVVALGRKNYLFVGHPRAGRNLAALYSLVGSCIANRIEPTEYLTDVLPRIRSAASDEDLDALLPDRWAPRGSTLTHSHLLPATTRSVIRLRFTRARTSMCVSRRLPGPGSGAGAMHHRNNVRSLRGFKAHGDRSRSGDCRAVTLKLLPIRVRCFRGDGNTLPRRQ